MTGRTSRRFSAAVAAFATASSLFAAAGSDAASASTVAEEVRVYREGHAREIVAELAGLVALPNLATDGNAIRANAVWLEAMLARRGLATRLLEVPGAPPAVLGEFDVGAERTVVFYAHYDGQPVTESEWSTPPWQPTLRGPQGVVDLMVASGSLDSELRLYGRSTADDKGPIVAFLTALDALRAARIAPSVNLKLFLEGEEERGSPHLGEVLRTYGDTLGADLWIFCDGPAHQTRRPQVVFGVRGVARLSLTTYGPTVPLHSGHYGNWAPDPGMLLARLVASLRDDDGSPRIAKLLEMVRDPGPTARAAIAAMPPVEAQLRQDLLLGWSEGAGATLPERLLLPAINLLGFSTGQVGAQAANAIPSRAEAVVGFRLVPDITPAGLRRLVETHLQEQGVALIDHEPSPEELLAGGKLVRVDWGEGYPALWTSMELPVSRAVMRVISDATGGEVVATPTMGGSLPLYLFDEILGVPVIVVPTVNHDNNQHAADENLRLANLWQAVDIFAALVARLGDEWR